VPPVKVSDIEALIDAGRHRRSSRISKGNFRNSRSYEFLRFRTSVRFRGGLMTSHQTKHIRYKDQEADIDVEIADLILNLWRLEISTLNSCQDGVPEGFAWIEFASAYDAEMFLDFVAQYSEDPDSVYARMTCAWGDDTALDWQYDPCLEDYGVDRQLVNDDEIEETFSGRHHFNFAISIRFPRQDLEFVKERIREAATPH
jgi:hypothetical protein